MEVHHHSHLPHQSKPWKQYLSEGLMIFVAVSLGYAAENIRHHYIEEKKAIVSLQNLYKDLKQDSISYIFAIEERSKQDSCYEIISKLYDEKKILNEIPSVYVTHSYLALRTMPIMNTMALDQIKNSGTLNLIENDDLKQAILGYASDAEGLKVRGEREFGFIDRMIDPISINSFEYKFFQELCTIDDIGNINNKISMNIPVPEGLKLNNQDTFDWNNYFSILSMLKTIRTSTARMYLVPTQQKCYKLIGHVRSYLQENNALID